MTSRLERSEVVSLVGRAKEGDLHAFELLVRSHLRACIATAYSYIRQMEDAEDVAQESLTVAFQKIGKCREPERFSGWLLQIVRTRSLNWIRRGKTRAAQVRQMENARTVSVETADFSSRMALERLLGELPQLQLQVLLLHEMEGWNHGEIARMLKIPEATSRWRLFNAKQFLRSKHASKQVHERRLANE